MLCAHSSRFVLTFPWGTLLCATPLSPNFNPHNEIGVWRDHKTRLQKKLTKPSTSEDQKSEACDTLPENRGAEEWKSWLSPIQASETTAERLVVLELREASGAPL
jgi:hypothetical protein